MSADLHIHVIPDEDTEKHVREYLKKEFWSSEIGYGYDKWFYRGKWVSTSEVDWDSIPEGIRLKHRQVSLHFDEKKVDNTPNIWVGEVSWLKAALFDDKESFVPSTVEKISELIGTELPVLTDGLIEEIKNAFSLINNTTKEGGVWNGSGYSLADVSDIATFLEEHKGKKVFTISW